jgi:hypothetical protein
MRIDESTRRHAAFLRSCGLIQIDSKELRERLCALGFRITKGMVITETQPHAQFPHRVRRMHYTDQTSKETYQSIYRCPAKTARLRAFARAHFVFEAGYIWNLWPDRELEERKPELFPSLMLATI